MDKIDKFALINIIGIIFIFVALLLSFFLFTVKTKNKLGNSLFATFIIITAIDFSGFVAYKYIHANLNLEMFKWTISLLNMPLFYLYTLSACYANFKLKPKHLLHLIPFIIANLLLTNDFYLLDFTEKKHILDNLQEIYKVVIFHIFLEIQYVFYMIMFFLLLGKYKKIYVENYTNTHIFTYKWLFNMGIIFLVAHFFVIVKDFLKFTEYESIFIFSNIIVGTVALLVLCWFVLKALYYPELFRGIDITLKSIEETIKIPQKLEIVQLELIEKNLSNSQIATQITFLKNYMLEKEPYLEPSLTIQELANQIKMPTRELSILINHHINQHFFDFVNEYRIQKAMKILKSADQTKLTILEILYQVGFNSKSSFNTYFKKYTNLTPTDFRNT